MGMMNPVVSQPIDKMSDKIVEGTPFFLEAVRTVTAKTQNYGEGEMVVCRVRGHENELGIWGSYLLAQAKAVDNGDLNKWYKIQRQIVPGFGKPGNQVKAFVPADAPAEQTSMAEPATQVA